MPRILFCSILVSVLFLSCSSEEVKLDLVESEAHYRLGIEFAQYALFKSSLEEFDLALKYNPNNIKAYNKKGLVYFGTRDYANAKEMFTKVIASRPTDFQAHVNLGMVDYMEGNKDAALKAWEDAIALNSKDNDSKAHNNIGNVYKERKNIEGAEKYYSEAIRQSPDNPLYLNNLAEVFRLSGRLKEARELLEKSVALDPKSMMVHYNLGKLFQAENKTSDAVKAFKKSLSVNPGYLNAYYELSNIYYVQNKKKTAQELMEKALAEDPKNSKYKDLYEKIKAS